MEVEAVKEGEVEAETMTTTTEAGGGGGGGEEGDGGWERGEEGDGGWETGASTTATTVGATGVANKWSTSEQGGGG